MPELDGTEKQVAWARELRDDLVSMIIDYIKTCVTSFDQRTLRVCGAFEEHEGNLYQLSMDACAMYNLKALYEPDARVTQWVSDMVNHIRTITSEKWYIDNRNAYDIPENFALNGLLDSYISANPITARVPGDTPLNGDANVAGGAKRAEQIRKIAMDKIQVHIRNYKHVDNDIAIAYLLVAAESQPDGKISWTKFCEVMVKDIAYALCVIKSSAWYLAYDKAKPGDSPDPDTQTIFYDF